MRKGDVFPSKYLSAADLDGQPIVLEILRAPLETLKGPGGTEESKIVLYFRNAGKALPLNRVNYDSVSDCAGTDETNDWPGTRIEAFPATCEVQGKTVAALRIRKPQELTLGSQPSASGTKAVPLAPLAKAPPQGSMDDEIPF